MFSNVVASVAGVAGNIGATLWGNKQNKRAAEDQMEFQREMSNNAHQREVNDLKAAGLNPILSAGGGGASTPSGALPNLTAPDIRLPSFTDVIQLDLERQKVRNQTDMVGITRDQLEIDRPKKSAEAAYKRAQEKLAQKGVIRADVEGKAAKGLEWLWKRLKENYDLERNTKFKQKDSSGGDLP